jgi:hypothetical protein
MVTTPNFSEAEIDNMDDEALSRAVVVYILEGTDHPEQPNYAAPDATEQDMLRLIRVIMQYPGLFADYRDLLPSHPSNADRCRAALLAVVRGRN